MKCYNHTDRDAVSQCSDCGRGLCHECTNFYSMPICKHCYLSRVNTNQESITKTLLLMAVLFIIGFCTSFSEHSSVIMGLLSGYVLAGIPWGWNILNMITPQMFLFMSVLGWIIYFCMKLSLAAFIGWFVTPFKLYQYIKKYIDIEKTKTDLSA